jgi:hypothetical protein
MYLIKKLGLVILPSIKICTKWNFSSFETGAIVLHRILTNEMFMTVERVNIL